MKNNKIFLCCLILGALILCGCNMQTVTDLYCLPIRSEEYTSLQSTMRAAMNAMSYSAPISGDNQQSVQTADLDGDGQLEYILFARDSSQRPLHILVFAQREDGYILLDTINCTGTAFDQVDYIQMDSNPGVEIVVGRQVGEKVSRAVSVYSLTDGVMQQLLTSGYTKYVTLDFDQNGLRELLVLRPGDAGNGVALTYSIVNGEVERSREVELSEPAENIKRVLSGVLEDGTPAVYVACSVSGSGGIVTDVFAAPDGNLENISFSSESGTSVQTLRNYYIYADDIDGDGVLELPHLITMKNVGYEQGAASQYIIRWFSLNADASEVDKLFTYHNYVSGWYVELDGELASRYVVNQLGNSYELSLWDEDYLTATKILTIYVLTGQNRQEQALLDNRFVLYRTESTIYAAKLEVASSNYGMSKETLIGCFHLIQEG